MRLDLSSASSVRPSNRELSGRLLVALGRCEMLTAWELAASVYGSRVVVRRGRHWIVSPARLWATRRSLRRLVERGAVIVASAERRRNLYALADREPLRLPELGR